MSSYNNEDKQRIHAIMEKFQTGRASDAEIREFDQWYDSFEGDEPYTEGMTSSEKLQAKRKHLQSVNHQIYQEAVPMEKPAFKIWPRVTAAATIILIAGAGLFYLNHKGSAHQGTTAIAKTDIRPGGNKAILTLANGRKISLTDAANGPIANQAGVSIAKTANGQLVYAVSNTNHSNGGLQYNTVETPKGGQYQVTLPDGTNVWLNAASSLKYPASFASLKDRQVELTGEAYFEVAKDKAHPFIVKSNDQDVEVLGTHFNINSYTDETATKTTLLEGSVKVNSNAGNEMRIKPGEQATLVKSGKITIADTDISQAVAWKNGKFVFNDEDITSIMRKLARWYNVEVIYDGDFSGKTFDGSISRYDNISKILDKIAYTQAIHFKIEGRRIVVMK